MRGGLASRILNGPRRINVEEQNARFGVVSLVVHVNGRRHLARVMRRIRNIRAITHISRVRH